MADILEFILDFLLHYRIRKWHTDRDWYGVVEEKKDNKFFSLSGKPCSIIFRIDDGSRKKLRMNKDEFNRYDLRKRYHKKRGDLMPDPQSGI